MANKLKNQISILPENVANQIAAGEVVQRPASVVKELMENSLDSGASEINVLIKNSGKTSIQVIDNGHGINGDEMKLAFVRHATSKLKSTEDLFSINTMGFRGEALASISAIAHVHLISKTLAGKCYELFIDNTHEKTVRETSGPVGVNIKIKNLFHNVPARRQFLKSDLIEFKHINDIFIQLSIANPLVRFTLSHNSKELAHYEPENLRQRISHVLGKKINESLIPIEESTELVSISGYLLRPSSAKKVKGNQYLFLNKRPIKSNYIHKAIIQAFEGLIALDMHPAYVIDLIVPNDRVDVNVHPSKTEVKFEDEHLVFKILCSAVKRSLGIHQVGPVIDFENNIQQHVSHKISNITTPPKIRVNPDFNPFELKDKSKPELVDFFSKRNKEVKQNSFSFNSAWDDDNFNVNSKHSYFFLPPDYIVTQLKSSLVIINALRAKQRILFDNLINTLENGEKINSQSWVFPEKLELLSKGNIELWHDELQRLGYHWEATHDHYIFSAGPAFLSQSEGIACLEEFILQNPEKQDYRKLALSWLSKITTGYSAKSDSKLSDLVDLLFQSNNPWTDPYGRTVTRILDSNALASQFK